MRALYMAIALTVTLTTGARVGAQKPAEQLFEMFKGLGTPSVGGLSETRIAEGLKEALRVGTEQAVSKTGRPDGYFGNALIKILLPDNLQTLEKGLRLVGYGEQIDEFVLSMNRAAEQAAPFAKQIFLDAVGDMTIADAGRILNGGETAATDFFKEKTSGSLYSAFRPLVDDTMNRVGTVRQYNDLLAGVQRIPFVKSESLEVGDYVTTKALDGLFLMVAEEERRIRRDPVARVTDLLQEVFGR